MQAKPRWMKAVLETAKKEVPALPFVRDARQSQAAQSQKRG